MKTKIQIKSVFGKLLFEYESEDNTIRKTLEEAIKINANLEYADLEYANLEYADLRNADLEYADLEYANLEYANLYNADLYNAKNINTAVMPIFCKWSFGVKGELIKIGCKEKTIKEWDIWFDSEEEYSTSRNTNEFIQIKAVYNALKSYYLTLNIENEPK